MKMHSILVSKSDYANLIICPTYTSEAYNLTKNESFELEGSRH
jgi:hypothetical protein